MEAITNNIVEFKIIFLCSIFIILLFNIIILCFNFCYLKLMLLVLYLILKQIHVNVIFLNIDKCPIWFLPVLAEGTYLSSYNEVVEMDQIPIEGWVLSSWDEFTRIDFRDWSRSSQGCKRQLIKPSELAIGYLKVITN